MDTWNEISGFRNGYLSLNIWVKKWIPGTEYLDSEMDTEIKYLGSEMDTWNRISGFRNGY